MLVGGGVLPVCAALLRGVGCLRGGARVGLPLFLPWLRVALLENLFASLGVVGRES